MVLLSDLQSSPLKRTRRSEMPVFHFLENCIFCGEICVMDKDSKNPSRWREVFLCMTADRGANKDTFKNVIMKVCENRGDEWAR